MDINSLNTYNSSTITQALQNSNKYGDVTSKDYTNATDEELMGACKEFEAYFVEQMFKSMQKMVPTTEYTSSGTQTLMDYYNDELISEYASAATEQNGGVGIAGMLYEQMKRDYEI